MNEDPWGEVVKWVRQVTGLVTIRGQESGPRPAKPYIMVNYLGHDTVRRWPQRFEYEEESDDPNQPERVIATPVRELEWRFSIHAYDDNDPTVHLRRIESALTLAQAQEPLFPDLVGFGTSEVRNVPDWDEVRWEKRAQFDFSVRGLSRDAHVVDTIEQYSFDFERS